MSETPLHSPNDLNSHRAFPESPKLKRLNHKTTFQAKNMATKKQIYSSNLHSESSVKPRLPTLTIRKSPLAAQTSTVFPFKTFKPKISNLELSSRTTVHLSYPLYTFFEPTSKVVVHQSTLQRISDLLKQGAGHIKPASHHVLAKSRFGLNNLTCNFEKPSVLYPNYDFLALSRENSKIRLGLSDLPRDFPLLNPKLEANLLLYSYTPNSSFYNFTTHSDISNNQLGWDRISQYLQCRLPTENKFLYQILQLEWCRIHENHSFSPFSIRFRNQYPVIKFLNTIPILRPIRFDGFDNIKTEFKTSATTGRFNSDENIESIFCPAVCSLAETKVFPCHTAQRKIHTIRSFKVSSSIPQISHYHYFSKFASNNHTLPTSSITQHKLVKSSNQSSRLYTYQNFGPRFDYVQRLKMAQLRYNSTMTYSFFSDLSKIEQEDLAIFGARKYDSEGPEMEFLILQDYSNWFCDRMLKKNFFFTFQKKNFFFIFCQSRTILQQYATFHHK